MKFIITVEGCCIDIQELRELLVSNHEEYFDGLDATVQISATDAIELDFLDREATPKEIMELAIYLHLGGLSLSNPVSVLNSIGFSRARLIAHN